MINNFNLLKQISIKNTYDYITKNNKKTFKIKKKDIENLSNSELIKKIISKHNIIEFCMIVNGRKIFNEFENLLGNIIFITENINVNDNIRDKLNYYLDKNILNLFNSLPGAFLINSYIGFQNPSFVKKFNMEINLFGNLLFIYPYNNDENFIMYDLYI